MRTSWFEISCNHSGKLISLEKKNLSNINLVVLHIIAKNINWIQIIFSRIVGLFVSFSKKKKLTLNVSATLMKTKKRITSRKVKRTEIIFLQPHPSSYSDPNTFHLTSLSVKLSQRFLQFSILFLV